MNPNLAEFLNDPYSKVLIGYELETQRSSGVTWKEVSAEREFPAPRNPLAKPKIVMSRIYLTTPEEAWELFLDQAITDGPEHCANLGAFGRHSTDAYINWAKSHRAASKRPILFRDLYDSAREAAEIYFLYTKHWYLLALGIACEAYTGPEKKELPIIMGHAVCRDSSVSGFEFKTERPILYSEVPAFLDQLFSIKHDIDERCSFHIHLSIPGMEHKYSQQLQQLLILSVLSLKQLAPSSVVHRWAYGNRDRHFRIGSDCDKYTFVSKHREFNTWEFRGFGAIDNLVDARTCIDMAIEAMHIAQTQKAHFKGMHDGEFVHSCLAQIYSEYASRFPEEMEREADAA